MAAPKPKQHVLTPAEIQQKWEYESAGRPWPPVAEHTRLMGEVAVLREHNQELREIKKHSPTELKKTLDLLFQSYGIDPAKELVELAISKNENGTFVCTVDQRIKIWAELLSYRAPKLKAIEMSGQVDHEIKVVIQKFELGPDSRVKAISVETPVVNQLQAAVIDMEEAERTIQG